MRAGFTHDCSSVRSLAMLFTSSQLKLLAVKDVHKAPVLDLVGWFTLASAAGPEPHHLPIHQQLLDNHNESALLLLFHPSSVADSTSTGGKLPLAIYESVYETITVDDGDKQMSGSEGQGPQHSLRFQELPYTIETGEAEMISVDFVAKGGANAAAVEDSVANDVGKPPTPTKEGKGKGKAAATKKNTQASADGQTNGTKADLILSPEDEDHIASLTAKANAIRMLQQRILLLRSYLQSLPPSYLTPPSDAQSANPSATQSIPADLNLDHQILRQISSLLARLPLLSATAAPAPTNNDASAPSQIPASDYTTESLRLSSDVALTSLLGALGTTLSTTQKMGRKAAVFESARTTANRERDALGGKGRNGAVADFAGNGYGEEGMGSSGFEEEVWDEMET